MKLVKSIENYSKAVYLDGKNQAANNGKKRFDFLFS